MVEVEVLMVGRVESFICCPPPFSLRYIALLGSLDYTLFPPTPLTILH